MRRLRMLTASTALALTALVLAACGSSEPDASTQPTSPDTVAASPIQTAAPSAELIAWAGEVCTETAALRDAVNSVAASAVSSGPDIGANLQREFASIQQQSTDLLSTVKSAPTDPSAPEVAAFTSAASTAQDSINALGEAITAVAEADGLGTVTALADLASAAGTAADSLGAAASAIDSLLADGRSTLGQAFAANPTCESLRQQSSS